MIKVSDLHLDIHTHTIVSGHAYGTIREMAAAAKEKNLEMIGFSEHGPGIPGTCTPMYFGNLKMAPKELYGVKLLYGSELNVMNDQTLSMPERNMNLMDYAIVGIHGLCYEDEGAEKNTDNVISYMQHPKVRLISHPDDDHTPLDYERLVAGAKKYGVALEVNNSSFLKQDKRLNCLNNYRQMLKLCMKHKVPIAVGSDAHDPLYVGRFEEACEFLNQEGFDKELIVNTSVEKWLVHIGKL